MCCYRGDLQAGAELHDVLSACASQRARPLLLGAMLRTGGASMEGRAASAEVAPAPVAREHVRDRTETMRSVWRAESGMLSRKCRIVFDVPPIKQDTLFIEDDQAASAPTTHRPIRCLRSGMVERNPPLSACRWASRAANCAEGHRRNTSHFVPHAHTSGRAHLASRLNCGGGRS